MRQVILFFILGYNVVPNSWEIYREEAPRSISISDLLPSSDLPIDGTAFRCSIAEGLE